MYRRFIFIGVIAAAGMMTFNIKAPVYFQLILLSFFQTLFLCFRRKLILNLFYIVLIITIGQIAILNISIDKEFIPIEKELIENVEITVLKDSKFIQGRYFSTGRIHKVYSESFISESHYSSYIYSNREIFKGEQFNLSLNGKGFVIVKNEESSINIFNKFRLKVIKKIKNNVCSGMLLGLLIGNKNLMKQDVNDLFRTTGTSHILALSGFHLSLIAFVFFTIFNLLVGFRVKYILTVLLLFFYINLAGVSPSLIRAFIMFIIISIYKVNFWCISILEVVCFSFLISIIFYPEDFYTVSFRLSYTALVGIIVWGNQIKNVGFFKKIPSVISESLCASIGASLGTSLIVLKNFGVFYPVGILASLILTPLIALYMVLGMLSIFVKFIRPFIVIFEELIIKIATMLSKSPSISINDRNSYIITLIFMSLPVILYLQTIVRSKDVRRFNSEFKL